MTAHSCSWLGVVAGPQAVGPASGSGEEAAAHGDVAGSREPNRPARGWHFPPAFLQKDFRVFVDDSVLQLDRVYAGGDQRGVSLSLAAADLLMVTRALPVAAARAGSVRVDVRRTSESITGV